MWLDTFRTILGERYQSLVASDLRGRVSPTPPKQRHGLMRVAEALENALATFKSGAPLVSAPAAIEALALIGLLHRWRNHPSHETLVAALDAEYEHTVITLAVASLFEDVANGVIVVPAGKGRSPDLSLVLGAGAYASVEVKAPRALIHPIPPISSGAARSVIKAAVKRAGTGKMGQLGTGGGGLLAVGGVGMAAADLDVMEAEAHAYLAEAASRGRHPRLMAIVFAGLGYEVHLPSTGQSSKELQGLLGFRLIPHSGYKGEFRMVRSSV
jgi:hypothetical protein